MNPTIPSKPVPFDTSDDWVDIAAHIAKDLRCHRRFREVTPAICADGTDIRHIKWMLMQLEGREVGSATKTCRWLGYAQAMLVAQGAATLEQMKWLTKTHRDASAARKALDQRAIPEGEADGVDIEVRVPQATAEFIHGLARDAGVTPDQAASVIAALSLREVVREQTTPTFQRQVARWASGVFGDNVVYNLTERCDRFMEEAIELLQSLGYPRARIPTLVDYVYNRPVGDKAQELGGVMVTLAVLSEVASMNMQVCGETELARIQQPEVMAKIRQKQATKRGIHDPRPGAILEVNRDGGIILGGAQPVHPGDAPPSPAGANRPEDATCKPLDLHALSARLTRVEAMMASTMGAASERKSG